jgi:hypothetical protein
LLTHREFVDELARAKKTMFMETPCGSVWAGQRRDNPGTQIADVIAVNPSYTRFCITIFECKVKRADFLGDIRRDKWRGYLKFCHRFYFVVPRGITDKIEVPGEAGLILYNEKKKSFYTRKAAPETKTIMPPDDFLMSLIFYRNKHNRNLADRVYFTSMYHRENRKLKKYGDKIARAISYYNQNHEDKLY